MAQTPPFIPGYAVEEILDTDNSEGYQRVLRQLDKLRQGPTPPWWRFRQQRQASEQTAMQYVEGLTALVRALDQQLDGNLSLIDTEALEPRLSDLHNLVDQAMKTTTDERYADQPISQLTHAQAFLLIAYYGTQAHALGESAGRALYLPRTTRQWIDNYSDVVFNHLARMAPAVSTTPRVARLVGALTPVNLQGQTIGGMSGVIQRYLAAAPAPDDDIDFVKEALVETIPKLARSGTAGIAHLVTFVEVGELADPDFREGIQRFLGRSTTVHPDTYALVQTMLATDSRLELALTDNESPPRVISWLAQQPLNNATAGLAHQLLSHPQFLPENGASLLTEPIRTMSEQIRLDPEARIYVRDYSAVRPLINTVLNTNAFNDPHTRRGLSDLVANFWPQSVDEMVRIVQLEAASPSVIGPEIARTFTMAVGAEQPRNDVARALLVLQIGDVPADSPFDQVVQAAIHGPEAPGVSQAVTGPTV